MRNWSKQQPGTHERTVMMKSCGKKCFLGPNKTFPICAKGTCKVNRKGVYAAYVRAKEYQSIKKSRKYQRISAKARKLMKGGEIGETDLELKTKLLEHFKSKTELLNSLQHNDNENIYTISYYEKARKFIEELHLVDPNQNYLENLQIVNEIMQELKIQPGVQDTILKMLTDERIRYKIDIESEKKSKEWENPENRENAYKGLADVARKKREALERQIKARQEQERQVRENKQRVIEQLKNSSNPVDRLRGNFKSWWSRN